MFKVASGVIGDRSSSAVVSVASWCRVCGMSDQPADAPHDEDACRTMLEHELREHAYLL